MKSVIYLPKIPAVGFERLFVDECQLNWGKRDLMKAPRVTDSSILVTIGLCVKNNEKTIEDALKSILNQNFSPDQMEIIVVDESTDRTLQIIIHFAEETELQTKVYHYRSMGLGPARNVVVRNARGRYIIWVDGDEKLPRDHVRRQVEFMERNPKVGAAKARYGFVESKKLVVLLENSRAFDIRRTSSKLVGTSGSIYRVEAIRGVGGFDNKIKGAGEDIEALNRMRKGGWLLSASDAVYYEVYKETWRRLWAQYSWWGFGAHYARQKEAKDISIVARLPPVAFLTGIVKFFPIFKRHHRPAYVLLPIHTTFKETAWLFGFLKAYFSRAEC